MAQIFGMKSPIKSKSGDTILVFVLFIVFVLIHLQHINADFWNDEIYTLKYFIFNSLGQTITDYHVPNNHVFFNILNNIYLKIIGIDSLHTLMDHPYMLRILPLCYAVITFFLTYKIARKFFNPMAGILALIALCTNIPYYNFALQIRGYGLSTVLLLALVYSYFSYQQDARKKYIWYTIISTTLLIYTVPSNLYPLAGLLLASGIFFVRSIRNTSYSFTSFKNNVYIHLIIAIGAGLGLSLLFYSPILKDVFFNEYVQPGTVLEFAQLKFYIPRIMRAAVSHRYILALLFIVGVIFNYSYYRKWLLQIMTIILICSTPIVMVYLRGDRAPLRTFSVLMPFFGLILAVGIGAFWRRIMKSNKFDFAFYSILLLYAVFTFYHQQAKIHIDIYSDLTQDGRSQDLYHQYYSAHYQPLKDVQFFNDHIYKSKAPVVVIGCEPHGISNYLNKFGITHEETGVLDSILSVYDSAYVVTNHPYKVTSEIEYNSKILSDTLTYHNFMLFKKSDNFIRIENSIKSISDKYGDSIQYVFNLAHPNLWSNFSASHPVTFITDDQYPELIEDGKLKRHTCYVNFPHTKKKEVLNILQYHKPHMVDYICNDSVRISVLSPSKEIFSTRKLLYENNFDDPILRQDGRYYDDSQTFSKPYSERLDANHEFSTTYQISADTFEPKSFATVSLKSKFELNQSGLIVFEVKRGGENVVWKKMNLNAFYSDMHIWHDCNFTFQMPEELKSTDKVSITIWNPEKRIFWIDDLKIELESPDYILHTNCIK